MVPAYLDITVPLGEVDSPECGLALPVLGVRGEDRPATLTLPTDDTTYTGKGAAAVKGRDATLSYALKKGVNGARIGR